MTIPYRLASVAALCGIAATLLLTGCRHAEETPVADGAAPAGQGAIPQTAMPALRDKIARHDRLTLDDQVSLHRMSAADRQKLFAGLKTGGQPPR